jgi:erythromycin esterase-like protein
MHNSRRLNEIGEVRPGFSYKGLKTMGDWLYEALGDETYNITFTAYKGKAGPAFSEKKRDIPEAPEGSIEYYLHQAGEKHLFVDFRGLPEDHWLRGKLPMRPLGYSYMNSDWTRHFDAVIFDETMEPSTRLPKKEDTKKDPGEKK